MLVRTDFHCKSDIVELKLMKVVISILFFIILSFFFLCEINNYFCFSDFSRDHNYFKIVGYLEKLVILKFYCCFPLILLSEICRLFFENIRKCFRQLICFRRGEIWCTYLLYKWAYKEYIKNNFLFLINHIFFNARINAAYYSL